MSTLSHVTSAVLQEPWLIHEPRLNAIAEIVESHLAGKPAPKIERAKDDAPWTQSGISFIPVFGTVAPKMGLMENLSGGTSIADLREHFNDALQDPETSTVAFLFDTPGGSAKGGFEFADEINAMRERTPKNIIAHIEGDCCSLGYLLASQCDSISMTVGSQAGSIGVVSKFTSRERQQKNEGIESTVIRSSPLKAIGADALTGDQMAHLQARIQSMSMMFQSYVGRNRNVDFSARDMAGVFPAVSNSEALPTALQLGLVDKVATRDQIISTYGKKVFDKM